MLRSDPCWAANKGIASKGCAKWGQGLGYPSTYVTNVYPDDWLAGYVNNLAFDAPVDNEQQLKISYQLCCRVCGLAYDNCVDGQTLMFSYIAPNHKYSPISTSLPRQYVVVNQPVSWSVPWAHPLNWVPRFRFATGAESGLTKPQPFGQWGQMTMDRTYDRRASSQAAAVGSSVQAELGWCHA